MWQHAKELWQVRSLGAALYVQMVFDIKRTTCSIWAHPSVLVMFSSCKHCSLEQAVKTDTDTGINNVMTIHAYEFGLLETVINYSVLA